MTAPIVTGTGYTVITQPFIITATTTNSTYTPLLMSGWTIRPSTIGSMITNTSTVAIPPPVDERTDEERAADEARHQVRYEEMRRRDRERMDQERDAEVRARALLIEHLDEQQRQDLDDHRWFDVLSNRGRRWRILTNDYQGNVRLLAAVDRRALASYCAHSQGPLPLSDHHLAQMLILATDEDAFIAAANVHRIYEPSAVIPTRDGPWQNGQLVHALVLAG